jgi:hypothetical protein
VLPPFSVFFVAKTTINVFAPIRVSTVFINQSMESLPTYQKYEGVMKPFLYQKVGLPSKMKVVMSIIFTPPPIKQFGIIHVVLMLIKLKRIRI